MIFDIFIYLQIIFYRNGGGKMDEITVGPRIILPLCGIMLLRYTICYNKTIWTS